MGYRCTGSDAASLLRRCLIKRNLFDSANKPVIRADNGPQFISHVFEDAYAEVSRFMKRYNTNRIHSSLKYKTPNMFNAQNLDKEIESMAMYL